MRLLTVFIPPNNSQLRIVAWNANSVSTKKAELNLFLNVNKIDIAAIHLHSALNPEPIHEFIYHLTDKFFYNCSTHPNPLVRQIGNYTLPDLHMQYRKYIHKRTKHFLLQPLT